MLRKWNNFTVMQSYAISWYNDNQNVRQYISLYQHNVTLYISYIAQPYREYISWIILYKTQCNTIKVWNATQVLQFSTILRYLYFKYFHFLINYSCQLYKTSERNDNFQKFWLVICEKKVRPYITIQILIISSHILI